MLIIEETGGRIYEDSTIFEFFFLVSKSILKRAFIKKKKKKKKKKLMEVHSLILGTRESLTIKEAFELRKRVRKTYLAGRKGRCCRHKTMKMQILVVRENTVLLRN